MRRHAYVSGYIVADTLVAYSSFSTPFSSSRSRLLDCILRLPWLCAHSRIVWWLQLTGTQRAACSRCLLWAEAALTGHERLRVLLELRRQRVAAQCSGQRHRHRSHLHDHSIRQRHLLTHRRRMTLSKARKSLKRGISRAAATGTLSYQTRHRTCLRPPGRCTVGRRARGPHDHDQLQCLIATWPAAAHARRPGQSWTGLPCWKFLHGQAWDASIA